MPFPSITTIDQSNPQLQRYGGLTVSPELAAQLAQLQQNGAMVGQDPFNGVPVPQEGDNLLGFLSMLHFAGNSVMASDLAQQNGVPQQDFRALMEEVNSRTSADSDFRHFLRDVGTGGIQHNPLLGVAVGTALAGALGRGGAAGGGAGGSTAGGAAGGAATYPVTTGPLAAG
ncbi:MAG TPA: hypothetical protein VFO94_00015, partial [Gammaproteobacteria bacterium]|nr:hypothetical protein [Gammaproteobacteria bacterium]